MAVPESTPNAKLFVAKVTTIVIRIVAVLRTGAALIAVHVLLSKVLKAIDTNTVANTTIGIKEMTGPSTYIVSSKKKAVTKVENVQSLRFSH